MARRHHVLLAALVVALAVVVNSASAVTFTLNPHEEECFFKHSTVGQKVSIVFQVVYGGSLDVDFSVFDPSGAQLYEAQRKTTDKFDYEARVEGSYRICFNNKFSTITYKGVSFAIVAGEEKPAPAADHKLSPIENSLLILSESLRQVAVDQEYLKMREVVHKETSDSTNSRVVWWTFFEAIVLIIMSAWQIIYLRRFFEVKTRV